MKRSEINAIIREAEALFAQHGFLLPPFARWSSEEWKSKGAEADPIRQRRLGWDLTDFGLGKFDELGLTLVTLRNGNARDPNETQPYAEKIMMVREGQVTPWHFHWKKMEDIIVRAGGNLIVQVAHSTAEEHLDEERVVHVVCDGVHREVRPSEEVRLRPGESITLLPGVYHKFWGEPGSGPVVVGEVSSVNDDDKDNRFLEPMGRFPQIEEDEPPHRLLCTEYPDLERRAPARPAPKHFSR